MLGVLCPGGVVAREDSGRPYFKDMRADFSISHSQNAAAVAVLPAATIGIPHTASIPRVGCDIQFVNPKKDHIDISGHFFYAGEQEYIASVTGEERRLRFCRVWCLKEAWLKMRGLSVFDMAQAPCFCVGEQTTEGSEYLYELKTAGGELYILAMITEAEDIQEPEIRWFLEEKAEVSRVWPVMYQ